MLRKKTGQSTAEYAIIFGLVIALAAGVAKVALEGGMKKKQSQALKFLDDAGAGAELGAEISYKDNLFSQEYRKTTVKGGDAFVDKSVMDKGGSEKKISKQTTETASTSVELLDKITP